MKYWQKSSLEEKRERSDGLLKLICLHKCLFLAFSRVTNPMFHNYCLNESSMKYNTVEFKYYKDRGLLPDCCQTAGNSAFNNTLYSKNKKSLYSLLKHQNLPAWVWKWTSKIQRATALIKYPVEDHFPVVRADGYSKLEVSSLVAGSQLHNFHVKCHSRARSNSRQLVCHLFSIYKYCPWNSQQIYQYFSFSVHTNMQDHISPFFAGE